jgi:hypothetical protein
MKYPIDFSIFDSPTHAYGNVTGDLEFSEIPQPGAEISLLDNLTLKVSSVSRVQGMDGHFLLSLEDVVCLSREAAARLRQRLESELGLFCIAYDEL